MDFVEKGLYVRIEEQLNRCLCMEETLRLRRQAQDWVDARLARQLRDRLGIPDALWRLFEHYDEVACRQLIERITAALDESGGTDRTKLSGRDRKKLAYLLADSPAAAAQWLWERLLVKERTSFREKAGLSPASWIRFQDCSVYTTEENQNKIACALGLDPEETRQFKALVIREFFHDLGRLRPRLMTLLQERELTIMDFLSWACISPSAWVPFQPNSAEDITSQGTLLKMVIGLSLSPEEGRSFLALVGSTFAMRRDLVVLACLHEGIYDIYLLHDILEAYARDAAGKRLFGNLYTNLE